MGSALQLPGANPTLKANPRLVTRKGPFTYTVESHGDKSTYDVTDGTRTISLPIQWSFGVGAQTWVFEREGKFYESLVSYFPAVSGLDTTMGDERLTPTNVDEAFGRLLTPKDARDCFGCHSTNSASHGTLHLASLQPGVTCEHCHTGTSTHLVDAIQGQFDSTPPDLKKLSSEDLSGFCGQCHRTWDTVVRGRLVGEVNVRFQPYRLANSKCFDGTDPRISCIACHDPHRDLVRQSASYDSKCLACHAASPHAASPTLANAAKTCPVAKSDCASCHMPKVKPAGGHMTFTDHQIRIVKAGEPVPN
jgi:hypothetical protein